MEPVREVLSRRRRDLLDRWRRQLRAAAEAGFALDAGTLAVLPNLLDATDRALVRRFRPPDPAAGAHAAEARRAAVQASLLADFVHDSVLEALPGLSTRQQRLLSQALTHAAVEVQVQGALQRDGERRRRESAGLAGLTHDLRNSATSASLALDLLRRRGILGSDRTARALERSLAELRNGIEDSILDEALNSGALRLSRVELRPVLADARSAAEGLGGKKVTVLLEEMPEVLQIRGDPRVVRPALCGLLRAAVQLARPGAIIRCGAWRKNGSARVAVSVNECQRGRGGRLAVLPTLTLARRAAKAHGGALFARLRRDAGCELRLDLPSLQPH